jgi:hypothetical protein
VDSNYGKQCGSVVHKNLAGPALKKHALVYVGVNKNVDINDKATKLADSQEEGENIIHFHYSARYCI